MILNKMSRVRPANFSILKLNCNKNIPARRLECPPCNTFRGGAYLWRLLDLKTYHLACAAPALDCFCSSSSSRMNAPPTSLDGPHLFFSAPVAALHRPETAVSGALPCPYRKG